MRARKGQRQRRPGKQRHSAVAAAPGQLSRRNLLASVRSRRPGPRGSGMPLARVSRVASREELVASVFLCFLCF